MMDGHGFGGGAAPVNVGEEMDVTIEAVGEKGDGIAKKSGFVLFVPNTKEGDRVRIKITKVLRRVGFADVLGPSSGAPTSGGSSDDSEEAAEPEEVPEDSEDFGEETSEDSADEPVKDSADEPADDSSEETKDLSDEDSDDSDDTVEEPEEDKN